MIHCGRCLPEGVMALALEAVGGRALRLLRPRRGHWHRSLTAASIDWLVGRVLRIASFLIANSRNTERILLEEWGLTARAASACFIPASIPIDSHRRPPDRSLRAGWGGAIARWS